MSQHQDYNGHSLCSTRDPQREASQWVALQKPSALHCWILGLGAGYHVAQLAKQYPDVLISVVDHRTELKAKFFKNFPQLDHQVQVEIVSSEEDLLVSKSFALFGENVSSVHIFRPAIQYEQREYDLYSKSLRGQTPKSCVVLSDMMHIGLTSEAVGRFKEFQIKEILEAVQSEEDGQQYKIIKLLRELVT